MNGYLVRGIGRFGDFPLALFATKEDALVHAGAVNPTGECPTAPKTGRGELGSPGLRDTLLFVSVIEFADGRPVAEFPVKSFVGRKGGP